MSTRAGCLTPIALFFVIGANFVGWGLAGEAPGTVRAGVVFLILAVALLIGGLIARHRGWWR